MKSILILTLLLSVTLFSKELQIKANSFNADEATGVSVFDGNVNIIKYHDELNASNVTIYTDKKNQPTKFVAVGNVSFVVETEQGALYRGKAQKVIYLPNEKEYHFFKNVHLKQINEKKEIIGDKVVLKTVEGKAYAEGLKSEPVIMIFKIKEEEK